MIPAGTQSLIPLLATVKDALPYLLRYETDEKSRQKNGKKTYVHYKVGHADQRAATVTVPPASISMREFLTIVVAALPGWQATVFPDRVILYRESADYQFAREYIPPR